MLERSHKDLDHGYAWVVAFANCWVNFSVYGLYRSYGVLFVAFMEFYQVNHQMAAWPFTLLCSIYHLIGPIVGILSHTFSLRALQIAGTLVAAFGVLFAFFATKFIYIIIFLGAIQGLGLGVIRTLSNVVIQQYFVKHRATATGIAMCGGTISSFFFPSFAEYVLETYGLKIAYLVFGAVMLQALIGIALQKPPSWELIRSDDIIADPSEAITVDIQDADNDGAVSVEECPEEKSDRPRDLILASQISQDQDSNQSLMDSSSNDVADPIRRKSSIKSVIQEHVARGPLRSLILIFRQPMFYVICTMFVNYNIVLQMYLMTIVDVAIFNRVADKGQAILLIVVFSVADLLGRVSFGWISDKGYAKPKTIAIITHFILCFFLILTPIVKSLFALRICAFSVGLLIGIITILWPLLNVDYFGTELLPLTLGLNCFFSGVESLIRPFIIGYFLDYLGRYDLLFFTVSSGVLMTAFLWLTEPLLIKHPRSK